MSRAGPRLKIDLTLDMYRFEIDSGPASPQPPAPQKRPQWKRWTLKSDDGSEAYRTTHPRAEYPRSAL